LDKIKFNGGDKATGNRQQATEKICVINSVWVLTTQVRYPNPGFDEKGTYGKFVQSGLIGCVEIEENLSTTYKVEK
jgi:hypothetical protein